MTNNNIIYCFITDENRNCYRAKQQPDGSYLITKNTQWYPITYNPTYNSSPLEFATNMKYLSLNRSINYPLEFIKDGAAILRHLYYNGLGIEEKTTITILQWDGEKNYYDLAYSGRAFYLEKTENPQKGSFTVPLVDISAWGELSRYDSVQFSFDCSPTNPKAVRVLIDGVNLLNTYTYQTVKAPISTQATKTHFTVPFALINQDGDSVGVIAGNQNYTGIFDTSGNPQFEIKFFNTLFPIIGAELYGTFAFECLQPTFPFVFQPFFTTNKGQHFFIPGAQKNLGDPTFNKNVIYSFDFNFTLDLEADESITFCIRMAHGTVSNPEFIIEPQPTNIFLRTKTKTEPQIVYGIRAGDLLEMISNKATRGKYTVNSDFFKTNRNDICISGDALRQVPNAELYTSFEEFFKTFNSLYWMALMNVNGSLWMEKFMQVYRNTGKLIDLGEASNIDLSPAGEFFANEIKVGSPNQDLNHPSGRLEFNTTNTFSLNIQSSNNKLDLITEYITGCYSIMFLILDYQGGSTTDNQGDKRTFLLRISDEQTTAIDNIETFENITVDNVILNPIIKSPLNNDSLTGSHPVIRGISQPGATVKIYADSVLDGSVVADINGNWSYNIVATLSSYDLTHDGVHVIDATFGDLSSPKSTINLTINTAVLTPVQITYPTIGDNLYNNKPLIKGTAEESQNVNLTIDGVLIASLIADASGKWEYKSSALSNGDHIISANGTSTVNFHVDTNVEHPLITYIGSELDGFVIINNLPLIQGVSKPFEYVTVWLNYVSYASLGTVQADINGNWSLQVVPVTYIDPVSGSTVVLSPIPNGLNVISTSLENFNVGIKVTGYKLDRPNYTVITGVPDNTVFNTAYTSKRMLKNHYPRLAAMLRNQKQEFIYYQTSEKNSAFSTTLGTEYISERADISTSELGAPFGILDYLTATINASKTFSQALYDFSSGAVFKIGYRGKTLYCLGIGSMKINSIVDTQQEWRLLLSTLTKYIDLLNLFRKGTTITLMRNSIYRSDKNSFHFVEYDYQLAPQYENYTIYQDWFNNRNNTWSRNPSYIQPYQTNDGVIIDQIVANGLANISLKMFRCIDATLVDTIQYFPVNPAPIAPPDVVLEAQINLSAYAADQYFFVMYVGIIPVMISERIETRLKWRKTILINCSSSLNEPGAFFSTGFKTILRVEGIIKKLQPKVNFDISLDDAQNSTILSSSSSRFSEIYFGNARGLPDYLYLKISDGIIMDEVVIENQEWSISEGETITPVEEFEGHPLYYYKVKMLLKNSKKGVVVAGADPSDISGITIVVNPTAIGLPFTGSLHTIELNGNG